MGGYVLNNGCNPDAGRQGNGNGRGLAVGIKIEFYWIISLALWNLGGNEPEKGVYLRPNRAKRADKKRKRE